jgi:hypothetical protein
MRLLGPAVGGVPDMVTGLAAVLIAGAVIGGLIAWDDPQGVRDDESWLRAGEEGW